MLSPVTDDLHIEDAPIRYDKRWSAPGRLESEEVTIGDLRLSLGKDPDGSLIFTEACLRRKDGLPEEPLTIDVPKLKVRVADAIRARNERIARFVTKRTHRRRLVVPKKGPFPEEFYRDVADLYTTMVEEEGIQNPTVLIAKANGVPVSTARGWIRQARVRGYLEPGQQGKLGKGGPQVTNVGPVVPPGMRLLTPQEMESIRWRTLDEAIELLKQEQANDDE
jgi:hypothetical protein